MYRKNLDAAYTAAASTPGSSNPLITAAEQPWEESANIVQVKSGFGSSGCKVGSDATTINGSIIGIGGIDSYTKLLLHMDDTGLTDVLGNAISKSGNAARSATQSKFGSYSLYLDGNGDYISWNDSADFDISTGNFVIDMWVYLESGVDHYLLTQMTLGGTQECNRLAVYASGILSFSCRNSSGTPLVDRYTAGGAVTFNTWKHIAIVRSGDSYFIFVDGVSKSYTTFGSGGYANYSTPWNIGAFIYSGGDGYAKGYIDEVRFSLGTDRGWSIDFTPPSLPYSAKVVSSDLCTPAGTYSFAPATLGFTVDGTPLQAPADLTAMDAACTVDYSFDASGADGATGFTGSPITPNEFCALAVSTFASKTHLFLNFSSTVSQVITAPKLTTASTAVITTKTGGMSTVVNGVTVYEVEADGDVVAVDISADDITMTGDLDCSGTINCSGEGNFDGNMSVGASNEFTTFRGTTSTDDGTTQVAASVMVGADAAVAVHAVVTANEAATANKNKYVLDGFFYRNGSGDVTQLGAIVSVDTNEGDAVWDATLVANTSTQSVDVQVSGEAGTTVGWKTFGYTTQG
jgi:hypothetical protein